MDTKPALILPFQTSSKQRSDLGQGLTRADAEHKGSALAMRSPSEECAALIVPIKFRLSRHLPSFADDLPKSAKLSERGVTAPTEIERNGINLSGMRTQPRWAAIPDLNFGE